MPSIYKKKMNANCWFFPPCIGDTFPKDKVWEIFKEIDNEICITLNFSAYGMHLESIQETREYGRIKIF